MSDWQSSLFGCFDDFGLCIITYFVPCYTFGKNAEAMGDSCLCCGKSNSIISILNIHRDVRDVIHSISVLSTSL